MTWSFKILRKALIIHGIQKNGNYYHARIISDLVSGYEDNSFTLHKKLQETVGQCLILKLLLATMQFLTIIFNRFFFAIAH